MEHVRPFPHPLLSLPPSTFRPPPPTYSVYCSSLWVTSPQCTPPPKSSPHINLSQLMCGCVWGGCVMKHRVERERERERTVGLIIFISIFKYLQNQNKKSHLSQIGKNWIIHTGCLGIRVVPDVNFATGSGSAGYPENITGSGYLVGYPVILSDNQIVL